MRLGYACVNTQLPSAARTARPEDVSDTRYAERLRASGFLATLPK